MVTTPVPAGPEEDGAMEALTEAQYAGVTV